MPPDPFDPQSVRDAYNAVADDDEAAFADDLERLPVDTAVLWAGPSYARAELEQAVTASGCAIEDIRERDPLEHEYPSRRIYITARAVTSRRGRRPVRG